MQHFIQSKYKLSRILIVVLLISTAFSIGLSQDTGLKDKRVEVILRNDQKFEGTVKTETKTTIVLILSNIGEITIEKSRIKSIKAIAVWEGEVDKKGYPLDYYGSSRQLINPSGYGLKKGQVYYENIYIFFNSFTFGVTDNFSVAAGGEVASLLFAGDAPILYISPRVHFPFGQDRGALSLGTIFFTIPESDLDGIGLAQTALTLGSRNNNINLGFGVGYSTDNDNTVFMFNLAATQRLSRKISLVTDNFIFTDGDFDDDDDRVFVISAALRYHFNKTGASLNVGLWRPLEDLDDLLAIPMISATIPLK